MCDLSVIIVNWNTRELLSKCLRSIYRNTKKLTFEVFLIDNASEDGSAEMTEKEFPQVDLVKNKVNFGFARANNQGFLRAKGKYVLVLNPDTKIVDDALSKMVKYLDLNSEVGAVGARFIYPDGTFQRYYRRFPTLLSIITTWFLPRSLGHKLRPTRAYLMLDDDFDKILEVSQPAGTCIMVRRDLFLEEDFMDEQFPIFFNDFAAEWRILQSSIFNCCIKESILSAWVWAQPTNNTSPTIITFFIFFAYYPRLPFVLVIDFVRLGLLPVEVKL